MQRVHWTEAQRQEAMRIYRERGATEASKATGIPIATISTWARRMGVKADEGTRPQHIAARELTLTERKQALADGLLDDVVRLRGQLFAGVVEKRAMVVDKAIEIAEVPLSQPTPADQNRIVDSMAKLLDKVLLLTGEATQRTETIGTTRDQALAVVRELRAS